MKSKQVNFVRYEPGAKHKLHFLLSSRKQVKALH